MTPSEYTTLARVEASHWWYAGMRRIAEQMLREIDLPPCARVLDAGCGAGGALAWLGAFGSPYGIDIHPLAARYAAAACPRVAAASVHALPFADGTFDAVTSFDVLYHLAVRDDEAALAEMVRVLRPPARGAAGGWLVIRVPAHDWLRRAHDRHVQTRHRYGRRELHDKLSAAGLEVVRLTPVGATLLPGAMARWLTQRSGDPRSDVVLPPAPVNHLLGMLLTAEAAWLRRRDLPAGLSLVALGRRR